MSATDREVDIQLCKPTEVRRSRGFYIPCDHLCSTTAVWHKRLFAEIKRLHLHKVRRTEPGRGVTEPGRGVTEPGRGVTEPGRGVFGWGQRRVRRREMLGNIMDIYTTTATYR